MAIAYPASAIVVSFVCACLGTRVASLLINDFFNCLRFPGQVKVNRCCGANERRPSRDRLDLHNEPMAYIISLSAAAGIVTRVFIHHGPIWLAYSAGLIGASVLASLLALAFVIALCILWTAHFCGYVYRRRLGSFNFVDRFYAGAKKLLRKEQK